MRESDTKRDRKKGIRRRKTGKGAAPGKGQRHGKDRTSEGTGAKRGMGKDSKTGNERTGKYMRLKPFLINTEKTHRKKISFKLLIRVFF